MRTGREQPVAGDGRCQESWLPGPAPVLAFFSLAALLACGLVSTPIRQILDEPAKYEGRKVRISGEVVDAVNLLVLRYYRVEDGTGRIAVVTSGAVPRRGARVEVRGVVHQAFAIGDESLTVIVEEPPAN